MSLAPIVLFTYNRPVHTEKTLTSLMKNELVNESDLFIFCDGAKENSTEAEIKRINEVREIVRGKNWCKKVYITESEKNKGLSNSVIAGVTEVLKQFGKIIVLEDDMITSKFFLRFMNDALDMYEHEEKVSCISGYVMPVKKKLPETFFIKGADCWGWATWKRSWDLFEPDGKKLLDEIERKNLSNEFDFNHTFPYTQMLKDQIEGKNDSWAIRWYASAFLKNKFLLYPGKSFVQNIGNDGSGSHQFDSDTYNVSVSQKPLSLKIIIVEENASAKKLLENYYQNQFRNKNISQRIIYKMNTLLKRI